jgi:hypothetical protein
MRPSSTPIPCTRDRRNRIVSPSLWGVAGALLPCATDMSRLMRATSGGPGQANGHPVAAHGTLEGERYPGGKKFPCRRDARAYGSCAPSVREQRRPARGCPSLPHGLAARRDTQANRAAGYARSFNHPSSTVLPLSPLCSTTTPAPPRTLLHEPLALERVLAVLHVHLVAVRGVQKGPVVARG